MTCKEGEAAVYRNSRSSVRIRLIVGMGRNKGRMPLCGIIHGHKVPIGCQIHIEALR